MSVRTAETAKTLEEIKSVETLLLQLVKTVKILSLYPLGNPMSQKFLTDLSAQFVGHLYQFGLFTLQVQQYELLHEGHVVYHNANRQMSLPLKLFLAGIAELVFHDGLEQGELARFLDILVKDLDPGTADDDTVTLLWEADFPHINFTIAEDYAGERSPIRVSRLAGPQPDLKRVVQEEVSKGPSAGDLSKKFGHDASLEIFQISSEEVAGLKAEMEVEDRSYTTARLIEVLTAILQIEKDYGRFQETMVIMDRLLAGLMTNGDWLHSAMILEVFRGLEARADLSAAHRKRLAEAIDQAGSADRIQAMEGILKQGGDKTGERLLPVLTLLNSNTLLPLCELLGRLESRRLRMTIADALVSLGTHQSEVLASKLTDARWYLVRNMVWVLGKIGDPTIIDRFRRLVHHPRVQVRKEVVRAVQQMNHPNATDLLLSFLKDPEEGIRMAAVRALGRARYQPARELLLQIIQSQECRRKTLAENAALFDALGRIAGEAVLPILEKILRKRSWFFLRTRKQTELGVCAALALKRIGTPRAIAALEAGRTLRDTRLRQACAKALEEMKTETPPPGSPPSC